MFKYKICLSFEDIITGFSCSKPSFTVSSDVTASFSSDVTEDINPHMF